MIKIKNLYKTYETSKGKSVIAINNISFELLDKGLVFVVGKSGSGKSTLLNLIGGLDSYDSGEIIIDGKSTKYFNRSEFDSYRNTLVGFVFQEYNLFDEFNVEKNISIAMELQGLEFNKEKINDLLKQIDLDGYSNRMPNELSTGQKQRVAFARALIKSPKIILADEPTGALDSKSGEQVLSLLKKLSKDKLIIVITHDYNYAQTYGDCIIELSDGNIIDDQIINKSFKEHNILSVQDERRIELNKSKMPLTNSIKIGLSGLKKRIPKFLIIILLLTITFIFFGLVDTFGSYDKSRMALKSIYSENINYITFNKQITKERDGELFAYSPKLKDEDINLLLSKFPGYDFFPIYKQDVGSISNRFIDKSLYNEFEYKINGSIETTYSLLDSLNFELIAGKIPSISEEGFEEIAISKYIYNQFLKYDLKEYNGTDVYVDTLDDVLGKKIYLNNAKFIIVGVIDTNYNEDRYDNKQSSLLYEENAMFNYGLHNIFFVREGYYNDVINNPKYNGTYEINVNENMYLFSDKAEILKNFSYNQISTMNKLPNKVYWKNGIEKTSLDDNQILIPYSKIPQYREMGNLPSFLELLETIKNDLALEFSNAHYHEIQDEYNFGKESYAKYIVNTSVNYYHNGIDKFYFENLALEKLFNEIYFSFFSDLSLEYSFFGINEYKANVEVVGFYDYTEFKDNMYQTPLILSDTLFSNFNDARSGDYNFVLTSLKNDYYKDIDLIDYSFDVSDYYINNEITESIEYINNSLYEISRFFLYTGFVFLIFSSILLYNFINSSIKNKKKEIGILLALGARRKDVFTIFYSEAFLINIIIIILSISGLYIICTVFNNYFKNNLDLLIQIFNPGIRQIFLMFLVSFLVTIISCFKPINSFAQKKPIEVIKNL